MFTNISSGLLWVFNTSVAFSRDVASFGYRSWYNDMFDCEENIGHGGFGHVLKVRNKLDRKYYAIKRVALLDSHPDACLKVIADNFSLW